MAATGAASEGRVEAEEAAATRDDREEMVVVAEEEPPDAEEGRPELGEAVDVKGV